MARVGVHEDPAYARDTALRRIRLTRGWMIAAAAGLTAGLAAVASALLPGKSLGAKSRSGGATALHTSAARPGLSPEQRLTLASLMALRQVDAALLVRVPAGRRRPRRAGRPPRSPGEGRGR